MTCAPQWWAANPEGISNIVDVTATKEKRRMFLGSAVRSLTQFCLIIPGLNSSLNISVMVRYHCVDLDADKDLDDGLLGRLGNLEIFRLTN